MHIDGAEMIEENESAHQKSKCATCSTAVKYQLVFVYLFILNHHKSKSEQPNWHKDASFSSSVQFHLLFFYFSVNSFRIQTPITSVPYQKKFCVFYPLSIIKYFS